jgi:uncharacterized protein involved in exopolysaccharide biosynthesis
MAKPAIEGQISLLDYWRVLKTYKWMIIGIVVFFTVAASAYAYLSVPVYRAEVLLAPAEDDKGGLSGLEQQYGGLAALAGVNVNAGSSSKEEAIAVIKSRVFLLKFIEDEKLISKLFYKNWDAKQKNWINKKPSKWDAYKLFSERILKINEGKNSSLILLAVEWYDRVQAAEWANKLVHRINMHMRQRAIDEAEKSITYLNQELAKTKIVELQGAIFRLIENQIQNVMLANVRDEFSFKSIDPAVVPEEDDYVKPKRLLIILFGVFIGIILGITLSFFRNYLRIERESGNM